MTAGEHLVALSGLSGVSAAAHLLSVDTNGGSGETVYAPWMYVQVYESSNTVLTEEHRDFVLIQQEECPVLCDFVEEFV